MDMNEATAIAIRRRMLVTGDTYRSLAAGAGIPERTLARILSAERSITMNRLHAIATHLGTTPNALTEDAEHLLGSECP